MYHVCFLKFLSDFLKFFNWPGLGYELFSKTFSWSMTRDVYFTSWRALTLCNMIPGVIGIIMIIFVPETPKFYLSKSENEKAFKILEWLSKNTKNKTLEELDITEIQKIDLGEIDYSKKYSIYEDFFNF